LTDHIRALSDVMRAGIDCYMSTGTAKAKDISGHRVHHVTAAQAFNAGQFTVYPFETEHDAAEPLGYLISYRPTGERLLYATDTFYLRYAFKGVHYMLIECNYCDSIARGRYVKDEMAKALYDRLMTSHFSLEHLKDFLEASDLSSTRQIVLIHLSDDNSDERRMIREVQGLTGIPTIAANRGMRLDLNLCPF